MKTIIKKIDFYIIKLLLYPFYFKICQTKSKEILKRGPEAYAEYTPKFIFDTLANAVHRTPVMMLKKSKLFNKINLIHPVFPRFKAPKIFFTTVLNNLVSKFELRKTSFDKIGRNDKIAVKVKDTGAKIQIKKKLFRPEKHIYLHKI